MMKNIFKKTEFLFGITNYSKLPEDVGNEVLLAGRSNAGKSSALNALSENPKLARISKTPGRTTEINFFKVNDELMLLDLPGYGFAKLERRKPHVCRNGERRTIRSWPRCSRPLLRRRPRL